MFQEGNSSLRAQLEENCELWRTNNTKDKYPRTFSRQMDAIVLIILQILFTTHVVLKIGEYHSDIPQF